MPRAVTLAFVNLVTWAVVFLPITAVLGLRAAIALARRRGRLAGRLAWIDAILRS